MTTKATQGVLLLSVGGDCDSMSRVVGNPPVPDMYDIKVTTGSSQSISVLKREYFGSLVIDLKY